MGGASCLPAFEKRLVYALNNVPELLVSREEGRQLGSGVQLEGTLENLFCSIKVPLKEGLQ